MTDVRQFTQQDSRAWDEIAQIRHEDQFPAANFFANGGNTLDLQLLQ